MSEAAAQKKQLEIVGAEAPVIPAIEELAGPYVDALYARRDIQVKESQLREQLAAKMRELGKEVYVRQDGEKKYTLRLEAKTKLSCKRENDDDGDLLED